MSIQTEKWQIILKDFDGWQTSRDSDDIPDGKSPNLKNVRITGSHVRGSLGYSLAGDRNATAGEISSKYTYNRNDGLQVMVRVKDNGSTGVLEWFDATNIKWYTLIAGLTTGKTMGFAEFNYSTADEDVNQLIFCNGTDNMSVWTGATTRLTSAVTATDTTINVESTANFPATGTIMYNGTEIAYTAKAATTFTVGSAHASAGANDGVAQAADDSTHSGITKGNILLSAKNRLWIAGINASPLAFDFSDEGSAFTFTAGANRTDSGSETALNVGGKITGLAEKGEEIILLGPDGAEGFSFTYPTSTTKAPNYREIFRTPGAGCLSPKSVFKVNQEVYFANKNGIAALSDLEGTEKVFNKSVTREVLPTLKDYVFDEAACIYFDKESILLMACKSDDQTPGNDEVVGIEFYKDRDGNDRMGLTRFEWPVNGWAILDDELYFGSSFEMNSFKGFDTYQHDGSPRTIQYAIKRFNLADPFQNKESRLIGVRGLIKDGTDIDVDVLFNAGFLGEVNKTIESDGDYVSATTLNSVGAFALGTNPIGANLSEVSELKEFTVFLDVGVDYTWRDIELVFQSETDGGTFMITHVGFAAEEVGFASEDHITI
jgi:hypothetical protein